MTVLLALGAALFYGVSDFTGGLGARARHPAAVLLVAQTTATAALLLCLPFVTGRSAGSDLLLGAGAGLSAAADSLCLYAALARGPMTTGAPLAAVLVAALPLGFALLTGECLGPTAWVGAPLAVIAVALVVTPGAIPSTTPKQATVAYATVSGVAFSAFFVLLGRTASPSGLTPLAIAYLTATCALAAGACLARRARSGRQHGTPFPWRLSLAAGLAELAAHLCYQYAAREGLLGIAAVLTALYPAATTLLARVVLRERPTRTQRIGYPLSVGAVVLLALAAPG
ncbi:EamA family transporter [Streptomyces sp. NPDC085944]|uniref:EamA family transporter n=1 Tax=Streptomyces sp. NPDC085944 TaxID=3154962 RepID=UPI003434644E